MTTSSAINVFEYHLESNLMKLLNDYIPTVSNAWNKVVVRGEDATVEVLPRIIVSTSESEEAVFQTGIYRATVTVTVKGDIDSGSPQQVAILFGSVMDVLQFVDLREQMNGFGNVNVMGIVLGNQKLEEVGDRMWIKHSTCDFFGYALKSIS